VNIYSTALEGLLKASGNCLLTSLSPRDFDRYKIERLKDHAPVTVNMELRALKAAFNVAFKWAYVPANPFAKGQSMQVPEKPPVFLTKEDFRALFEAIKDEWLKEIFVFAVFTGMRLGEIVHLHWAQVDLENRLIHIQSNPTFKTKQGKRRTIPMNEVVFRLLQTKQNGIKGELVFSIEGQPISESWVTHRFKKYVTDAKLDESIHFHSLRHTFASWLVQAGSTLFEVQKLLGHSSSAVTEVYAHLQPTHMHETVNRICLQLDEHAD
jgi:integrase